MKKNLYRVGTGILLAGWMMVIFLFSAQPSVESGKVSGTFSYRIVSVMNRMFRMEKTKTELEEGAERIEHPVRKIAHMTEYAILGVLAFYFCVSFWVSTQKSCIMALCISVFYAVTDEFHQLFVPGRSGRVLDVFIDTAGVVLGLACLSIVLRLTGRYCEKKKLPLQ